MFSRVEGDAQGGREGRAAEKGAPFCQRRRVDPYSEFKCSSTFVQVPTQAGWNTKCACALICHLRLLRLREIALRVASHHIMTLKGHARDCLLSRGCQERWLCACPPRAPRLERRATSPSRLRAARYPPTVEAASPTCLTRELCACSSLASHASPRGADHVLRPRRREGRANLIDLRVGRVSARQGP